MIRWCTYCQRFTGEKPPFADLSLTHGVCENCIQFSKEKGFESIEAVGSRKAQSIRSLYESALAGRYGEVKSLVESLLTEGERRQDILLGLMQPLLYQAGDLWRSGRLLVEQEHRMTGIFEQIVDEMLSEQLEVLARKSKGKKQQASSDICLTIPEKSFHTFGSKALEVILIESGLRVTALRPTLPLNQWPEFLKKETPQVIAVTVALPEQVAWTESLKTILQQVLKEKAPTVLIGGAGISNSKEPTSIASILACFGKHAA